MFHLLRSVARDIGPIVEWVPLTVVVMFGFLYVIERHRRHPSEETLRIYRGHATSMVMMCFALWNFWAWFAEGDEILPLAVYVTGLTVVWTPVLLLDMWTLKKGGPEALMAKAGGPGAKHRDLWEWMYVCEDWLRNQGLWRWFIRFPLYALCFLCIALFVPT